MKFKPLTPTTKKATSGDLVLLKSHDEHEVYLGCWNTQFNAWKVAGISSELKRDRFSHYATIPTTFQNMPPVDKDFAEPGQVLLRDTKGNLYLGTWNKSENGFALDGYDGFKNASVFTGYLNAEDDEANAGEYADFLSGIKVGDSVLALPENKDDSIRQTYVEGARPVIKVTRDYIITNNARFSRKSGLVCAPFWKETSIWPSEKYRDAHMAMINEMQEKLRGYGVKLPRTANKEDAKKLYALLKKIHRK